MFKKIFIALFSFAVGLYLVPMNTSAQVCPHSACTVPGQQRCYNQTVLDPLVSCTCLACNSSGASCAKNFGATTPYACDTGGSCQTVSGVCSSDDSCAVVRDPSTNFIVDCNVPGSCTAGSCCGAGSVTSTGTPTPTSPPPATNTPIPPTLTPTPVPCEVTTNPSSLNLIVGGGGQNITATVTSGLGSATIAQMSFGSYNTGVATVNPSIDFSSIYQTTVTAVSAGSTAVWATAILSDGRTCPSAASTDTNITVSAPTGTPVPPTPTPTPVPCQVTTNPTSLNLILGGGGQNITASVTLGLGSATVANMAFGSYNTGVATVNPLIDFTSVYQTTVTAVSAGSTAVWATATLSVYSASLGARNSSNLWRNSMRRSSAAWRTSLKKFSPRARIIPRNSSPDSGASNRAMVEPTRLPTTIPIKKPNILFMEILLVLS